MRKKLIAVVGPTASGKTALALALSKKFNGILVSADSRQVYKGLDIGTGKEGTPHPALSHKGRGKTPNSKLQTPNFRTIDGVRQYMVDVVEPGQEYSVAAFCKDAKKIIKEIWDAGKVPIVVGGTGLWVEALIWGYSPAPKVNATLRAKLSARLLTEGLSGLVHELKIKDPLAYGEIDLQNPRRVLRALEVFLSTGKSIVRSRTPHSKLQTPNFDYLLIGPKVEKTTLDQKIEKRVGQMFRQGLVEEVQGLVKKYGAECEALNAIGYKEIINNFQLTINNKFQNSKKKISNDKMDPVLHRDDGAPPLTPPRKGGEKLLTTHHQLLTEIVIHTRQYAKRQMTWWRKKNVAWVMDFKDAQKLVDNFLKNGT